MIEYLSGLIRLCFGVSPLILATGAGMMQGGDVDWDKLLGSGGLVSGVFIAGIWMRDRAAAKAELKMEREFHESQVRMSREATREAWGEVERVRKERDEARVMCVNCELVKRMGERARMGARLGGKAGGKGGAAKARDGASGEAVA